MENYCSKPYVVSTFILLIGGFVLSLRETQREQILLVNVVKNVGDNCEIVILRSFLTVFAPKVHRFLRENKWTETSDNCNTKWLLQSDVMLHSSA